MNKKGLNNVVTTILLFLLVVVGISSFNGWFKDYQSGISVNTEIRSSQNSDIKIENIIGDSLYLHSSSNKSYQLKSLKIIDNEGKELCNYQDDKKQITHRD